MQNLASFHFDNAKSATILHRFAEDYSGTQADLADEVGLSLEELKGSILNRTKRELSFERAFKICIATGHQLDEYLALMLADCDIDFADRVNVIVGADWVEEKLSEFARQKAEGRTTDAGLLNSDAMNALLDRFKVVHVSYHDEQIRNLKENRDLLIKAKDEQIHAMQDNLDRQQEQIGKLRSRNKWLGLALTVETCFIAVTWFMDALIGDRGWILRSWMGNGGTSHLNGLKG